ncbi:MAG: hypothetical protein M3Q23_11640 [Actinomycetota bacterium]|nr:hypothetical protein [Actinomycetota bacterium]
MGKRFDPKHWPQTARTRWRNWRTRKEVVPLQEVEAMYFDEHGHPHKGVGLMGYVDIPRRRRKRPR